MNYSITKKIYKLPQLSDEELIVLDSTVDDSVIILDSSQEEDNLEDSSLIVLDSTGCVDDIEVIDPRLAALINKSWYSGLAFKKFKPITGVIKNFCN